MTVKGIPRPVLGILMLSDVRSAIGRKQSSRINLRPAAAPHKIREPGQHTAIKQGFLMPSHRPVRSLACPARFERATYALEAIKMI